MMAEEKLSMEVSVEENGTFSEPVDGNGNNEEEASSEPSSTMEKDEDETKEVAKKKKKKSKSKKKKELPEQTDPPSIPITDLFPSVTYGGPHLKRRGSWSASKNQCTIQFAEQLKFIVRFGNTSKVF
jgi:hypothetical protein